MDKSLVVLFVVLLSACTIKYTSIEVPQDAAVGTNEHRETTINTPTGTTTITQTITVSDSAVKTTTDQDADADVPIALGMPGSTPASSVGNVVQEGVQSSNTVPIVVPPTVVPPVIVPASEKLKPEVTGEDPLPPIALSSFIGVSECKSYTRIEPNEKSTCRIWDSGFNEKNFPIRFMFDNDCGEFTIQTATEDYVGGGDRETGDKEDYVYFVYEKGSPSVFTQANCVASKVSYYKAEE